MTGFSEDLYAYHGHSLGSWLEDTYGNVNAGFVKIGSVKADLSPLASSLVSHIAPGGSKFYKVKYDVGISFGANSLFCKVRPRLIPSGSPHLLTFRSHLQLLWTEGVGLPKSKVFNIFNLF